MLFRLKIKFSITFRRWILLASASVSRDSKKASPPEVPLASASASTSLYTNATLTVISFSGLYVFVLSNWFSGISWFIPQSTTSFSQTFTWNYYNKSNYFSYVVLVQFTIPKSFFIFYYPTIPTLMRRREFYGSPPPPEARFEVGGGSIRTWLIF